jgi:acid phosphatase type 7
MNRFLTLLTFLFLGSALFGQSTESLRITHGPWLQNLTTDGVTVCWTTNLPAVPGVWITNPDNKTDFLVRNSKDGLIDAGGTIHKVRITGLEPGANYTYKLSSVELLKLRPYQVYFGDTLKGKENDFTTLTSTGESARVLVVNDIHTNGARLAGLLKSGKAAEKDLVFFNGDIVDNFEFEAQLLGPIIDTSVRYFASGVPFVFVRGNHETRGIMSRNLKDYLDLPDNRYYFAFDQGPAHFVVLDCGEDKPDNNRYYYGLADYDRYRLEQVDWLREHVKISRLPECRIQADHCPHAHVGWRKCRIRPEIPV